jgi:CO dehydrogenase/acetyl-CoA synthase beta subunit
VTNEQRKLVEHMFESLERPTKDLTKWELGFIESITEQWTTKEWISDRQLEILEKIYADRT